MAESLHILVVEDDRHLREALGGRFLDQGLGDKITLAHDFETGLKGLRALPDVALFDACLDPADRGDRDGLRLALLAPEIAPDCIWWVLTGMDLDSAAQAKVWAANGFIARKPILPPELRLFVNSARLARALRRARRESSEEREAAVMSALLDVWKARHHWTPKQTRTFKLGTDGLSRKEIAHTRGITYDTLKKEVQALCRKMQKADFDGAVNKFLREVITVLARGGG